MHRRASEREGKLKQRLAELEAKLRLREQQLFGRSTGGRINVELPSSSNATRVAEAVAPEADRVRTDAEIRQLEADNIRAALKAAGGKVSGPGGAAQLLGMKPTTLASRIKALGIVPQMRT